MSTITTATNQKILSIDIGGSKVKATILDENGNMMIDYQKVPTPDPATPDSVIAAITTLTKDFPPFNRISAGFPGYLKKGVVFTAPNLHDKSWRGFNLAQKLSELFKVPARVVNDADMQALGIAKGKGLEMMITLGTGFGTALLQDGVLLPHLEMAHHPVTKKNTYDQYIGDKAFDDKGVEKWNQRMKKVIEILKTVFNYDHLYLGGGNASKINFELDKNIEIVTNKEGILGGAMLWKQADFSAPLEIEA